MSYCSESKSLALTKVSELARKEMLRIKYHLKDTFLDEGIKYMFLQDGECCLDCDELMNIKVRLK
jgi:hypothetical protein